MRIEAKQGWKHSFPTRQPRRRKSGNAKDNKYYSCKPPIPFHFCNTIPNIYSKVSIKDFSFQKSECYNPYLLVLASQMHRSKSLGLGQLPKEISALDNMISIFEIDWLIHFHFSCDSNNRHFYNKNNGRTRDEAISEGFCN
jgi:hypothetical protein